MQLNEATGELDFSRNFMQQRRGDEDFNQERETLFQRIMNVQNQLKMQHDTESELRCLTDTLSNKQRHMENLIVVKEEEILA